MNMKDRIRFWNSILIRSEDECWPWLKCNAPGYGRFRLSRKKLYQANRIAFQLSYGIEIPPDLDVCHSCDNRICCNPKHLWLGTRKQNMQDAASKGRLGGRSRT
jgi:hypothetical protein